jgi:ArsR family transcriptional regulator
MQKQQIQAVSQFFKLLGHPVRLRMVTELLEKEQNVSTLVKKLKIAQPTISHYLALLRACGVVATRRSGREVFSSINGQENPEQAKALRAILATAHRCMQDLQIEAISQLFKMLGATRRLQILAELVEKEQNVSVLRKTLKMAEPTVSNHLGVLRRGGVVEGKRSGKEIFYCIPPKHGKALRAMLETAVAMFKA